MASTRMVLTEEEIDKLFARFSERIKSEDVKHVTDASPILLGGMEEISLKRVDPEDIEKYLLMHPAVPRGIEIKANRMTSRGFKIIPYDSSEKAKEAAKICSNIFENSDGGILINNWIQDTFAFGNGYLTLVPNKKGTRILRLNREHPIYFSISKYPKNHPDKDKRGKYKIDPKLKIPQYFAQRKKTSSGEWEQFNEIQGDRVAHLKFDTWGDEQEGISMIQYLYRTLTYLMNIEEAGAQTMWRNGFVQKKVTTKIKSEAGMKKLAKSLSEINSRDAVLLPDGVDVTNLNPGTVQFADFHKIFLKLVAIRMGIPLPILTLDGTSTNKATMDVLTRDMMDDLKSCELIVETTIRNQIFKPALGLELGEDFDKFPYFKFNMPREDQNEKSQRMLRVSQSIESLVDSAKSLIELGKIEEANLILESIKELQTE